MVYIVAAAAAVAAEAAKAAVHGAGEKAPLVPGASGTRVATALSPPRLGLAGGSTFS